MKKMKTQYDMEEMEEMKKMGKEGPKIVTGGMAQHVKKTDGESRMVNTKFSPSGNIKHTPGFRGRKYKANCKAS